MNLPPLPQLPSDDDLNNINLTEDNISQIEWDFLKLVEGLSGELSAAVNTLSEAILEDPGSVTIETIDELIPDGKYDEDVPEGAIAKIKRFLITTRATLLGIPNMGTLNAISDSPSPDDAFARWLSDEESSSQEG